MAAKLEDYLTKQILIEHNIVTFRVLSRKFNIHVNEAKRELATFYESTQSSEERSYATYLISGEAISHARTAPDESMDVDMEGPEEDDSEEVPQLKMTLVGEQDLEAARSGYARIFSEHVYSLSPSPVLDVGLLCGPSDAAHTADAKFSPDESATLGRIIGPHVQIGKPVKPSKAQPITREPTKIQTTPSFSQKSDSKSAITKKADSSGQSEDKTISKPKTTGKLDFSKAKPKAKPEEPKAAPVKVKAEPVDKPLESVEKEKVEKKQEKAGAKTVGSSSSGGSGFFAPRPSKKKTSKEGTESEKEIEAPKEKSKAKESAPKRGLKRKSIVATDTETELEAPPPPSSAAPSSPEESQDQFEYTVKGNTILSDDDDDEPQPKPRARGKAAGKMKAAFDLDFDDIPSRSERTRSLKAMMDIDDDQVEKVVRNKKAIQESSDEAIGDDEDVVMADDSDVDVPPVKPKRQRKPKKVVPVGKNGLKKRRVVKSRMTTDAKGYMVTEDYSEYESVDEEEADEEPPKPKPKPKKAPAKAKEKEASTEKVKEKEKESEKDSTDKEKEKKEPKKGFKPGLKRSGSSASAGGSKVTHKGSLMNFFGKK
ncbi:DNA polymerase subunit Cdc27-domain-containing protein [Irpex lacteus]|nr:DNA polymerase subunit Cdc27-domain-containing protein [Irpex lacteus]